MLLAAAALLLPITAQAETLSPVVVTADRIAEDPGRVSTDVSVIDRAAIEKSQQATVADLLRSQVGLDVSSNGGPGKTTSVYLRGANSDQVLVLIDGVRVGSATTGSFDWANLSTADIERIEIARGPQSSLYGAEAMGGVIQIFTRKGGERTRVHAFSEGGSYRTGRAGLDVSGMMAGDISYAFGLSGTSTKGFSVAANTTEKDPYRRLTGTAHVNAPIGAGEVELVYRDTYGRTSLDNGFGPADLANFNSTSRQTVSSVKGSFPVTDMLDSSLQLSRSTDISDTTDPVNTFNTSDFRTDIDQLSWQNHADLGAASILFGAEWRRDKGFSSSSVLDKAFTQKSAFGGLSYDAKMGGVNASVRYDANSATSNKATYKVGGVLRPLEGVRFTANYGTGFKAPSINQLYYPNFGNPNLQPEQSRGWDAGVHYRQGDDVQGFGFDVVWFDQRFTNLIVTTLVTPPFTYAPLNVGKARTKGLELSADFRHGPGYVHANWTYLSAKDSTTGTLLPRRAKESGNVTLGATYAGLNAEFLWHVVGPRYSTTGNRSPMRGYRKSDIHASYAIDRHWKLTGRIDNVENKHYEEVSGYSVPGRAWYAGVETSL